MSSSSGASAAAIQHHYDVSDDFYRLWLDQNMVYSAAFWADGDDLDAAQRRKLDHHIHAARAPDAARVLDVGCGWGALLRRLVQEHRVQQAVGLSLSQTQVDHIQGMGLPGVEARLEAWASHTPDAPYDAIVSIGAFEHFAAPGLTVAERVAAYRSFFEACWGWLRPGGWLSLQTIAYGNAQPLARSSFLAEQIFRESELPRLAEIVEATECLFEVELLRNDRAHYERTCRAWLANLRAQREAAHALVGEAVFQRYERYLKLVTVGFYTGQLTLLRVSLRRIDRPAGGR